MRMAVTGRSGQVALSLAERAEASGFELVTLARPEIDLADPASVEAAVLAAAPDVVVSAAAYTAVDKAESEADLAARVNRDGPQALARAATRLGIPIVHLSTDYVFDGTKGSPYMETDPTSPLGVYGATKLAGEAAIASVTPDHAILRTSWVYSPFGSNFVKTMLRLASTRDRLTVVADQFGRPSYAPDIAAAVFAVARRLIETEDESGRGVFHLTGTGDANWYEFASAIIAGSIARGGRSVQVAPITTADYPTPAKRPADSRLDCSRLASVHGIALPEWRGSLELCLDRLHAG
ncbi:dTDP-4-dehydrorhamnose reductase [Kaistia algarum]|uniref:dTDP-4-dehydrorhamnose reductase n=1 Tax=Kaistia algarum TaxID=2083279 RepID=UPI000CE71D3C|nr:dTDP-4-dehydrorhamnose reductase [Kaistia algarum]MCX5516596.1 dTDP-4-dehydrorhamnose reductase [Kaistia algarum]PPE77769.1 dTDP-4-dehydrorhamnose reductase [Kaistia algarum]